jgi:hypothetical protein
MQRRIRPYVPVSLVMCFACSGGDSSGPGPSGPPAVASVTVSPAQVVVEVGATTQLSAQVRDAGGNLLSGRTVSWASSNGGLATVDQTGLVLGMAPGSVMITATAEGRSGSAAADVRNPPVATIEIGPSPAALAEGESVQLSATAKAANGNVIAGTSFAWATSNAAIVQVSAAGLATALGAGQATVSASAGTATGNLVLNVTPAGAITITQIAPAVLVEGQPATLTGSGFSATAGGNTVAIGGVTATVTQASASTLQIVVPTFDCRAAANATVQVSVGARISNAVQQMVSPAAALDLQIGELAVLRTPADLCLQFAPSATAQRYVFGVQSVSDVVSTLTPVTVSASVPTGAATSPQLPSASFGTVPAAHAPPSPAEREAAERWASHVAITGMEYERERAMYQQLADRVGPLMSGAMEFTASTVPGTVAEGDEITVRFPNIGGNTCTEFSNINVRVGRISTRAIALVDLANPVAVDAATLTAALNAFDVSHDVAVDHFGEIGDLDENGRIVIVITREVNRLASPPLGFVIHSNLFTVSQCPSSNEGEFMFIRAPDPDGLYTAGVYTATTFSNNMDRLLMHEFTHNIQGHRRRLAGGQFMASWLAEGLATGSEEALGLHVLGLQQGGNYGQNAVYASRGADPRMFFGHVGDLLAYFGFNFANGRNAGAPEECSWVGSTSAGNPGPCSFATRLLYGVPWSIIKHTIDRQPGGAANQKQFLRAFSNRVGPPGFADLEAVFALPISTILAEWAPMLYLDDRYPAAGFQLLNFNIRNVAAAWNSPNADLVARMHGFGSFTSAFTLRAGSSSYHEISGANRPATAIAVRDGEGNPLPNFLQVWIVRVQ